MMAMKMEWKGANKYLQKNNQRRFQNTQETTKKKNDRR